MGLGHLSNLDRTGAGECLNLMDVGEASEEEV